MRIRGRVLTEARDALFAAGDIARATEAEMLISISHWMSGRRDLATTHADRAAALLADAPPVPTPGS